MRSSRRIGILGGMFDPIHCGHLDVGAEAARALDLSEVLVIPAAIPPHRPQPIASPFHRFAMTALAISGRRGWRALDIELQQPETSYTSTTLQRFHAEGFRPSELFFITGADAFLEVATWRNYPAVLDLAHFVVVARRGAAVSDVPNRLTNLTSRMVKVDPVSRSANRTGGARRRKTDPIYTVRSHEKATDRTCIFLIDAKTAAVSSSAIRSALREHRSIAGMVPPSVQQHIEQHGLYNDTPPDSGRLESPSDAAAGRLHGES